MRHSWRATAFKSSAQPLIRVPLPILHRRSPGPGLALEYQSIGQWLDRCGLFKHRPCDRHDFFIRQQIGLQRKRQYSQQSLLRFDQHKSDHTNFHVDSSYRYKSKRRQRAISLQPIRSVIQTQSNSTSLSGYETHHLSIFLAGHSPCSGWCICG